jgi:PAS domain S-box-containing protein
MQQIGRLHERIHLMEMVNDASIDGIMVFDKELNALYWNKAIETMSGIPREVAVGHEFFDLFPFFSDSRDIHNAIARAISGVKVFVPYDKCSMGGGYQEQHFIPLKSEGEEVLGILVIQRDVADRVHVEKELKSLNRSLVRKNKELKSRNEEILSFSHITSHDLKEPLHKIYSFAEMIFKTDSANLSDTGKTYCRRIQAAAQRMRLLTDDILTYCQVNVVTTNMSNVNLGHIALLAHNTMQIEFESNNAKIQLSELPTIKGYRHLLLTLFQNIFCNSIKFHRYDSPPVIEVSSQALPGTEVFHPDALSDTQYLRVSFKDNGIGFDQHYAEQIFQMFFKINDGCPGTGIGLTVCKKIAELHHGFITADGEIGTGCTVNLFLPIKR